MCLDESFALMKCMFVMFLRAYTTKIAFTRVGGMVARAASNSPYASLDEKFSIAGTVIIGVLGLAYAIYHIVLKFRLSVPVAKGVWCVAGLFLFTFLGNCMSLVNSYVQGV
jgi:hypothetical protein